MKYRVGVALYGTIVIESDGFPDTSQVNVNDVDIEDFQIDAVTPLFEEGEE